MPTSSPSRLSTIVGAFAAPSRAFADIRDEKPIYLPLMLLLAGAATVGFVAAVTPLDTQSLSDAAAAAIEDLPAEQRGRVTAETVTSVARGFLVLGPAINAIGAAVYLLIFGFVLWVAGIVAKDGASFRASLSLAAWASLPVLITDIAIVADFVADGQWADNVALSIAFFGFEPARTGGFPMPPMTYVWVAALVAVGYRQWHAASIPRAVAIGVLALGLHLATWSLLPGPAASASTQTLPQLPAQDPP